MKKQTVFIDLKGVLGKYVKKVFTEHKTIDVNVQTFRTSVNVLINKYQPQDATAENCEKLWLNLVKICQNVGSEGINKEDVVYKEIISAIDNIGYSIAYLCKRKSGGWYNREVRFYPEYTDEENLKVFKILILNLINRGVITDENAKVDYKLLSDDELLSLCKEYLLKKRESEVEGYGFKLSTLENEFSTYSRNELYRTLATISQAIDMIKNDRIPVLTGDNEEYKRRLINYVNSGKAADWETLDVEKLKGTLERFEEQKRKISAYLQAA